MSRVFWIPIDNGIARRYHNATLGPSRPRTTTLVRDLHLLQNQTSDARHTKPDGTPQPSLRSNFHQDNPGDPDDGTSSDETYLPSSTLYSNTESDITDSESCDQSSRTMPHRHLDNEH